MRLRIFGMVAALSAVSLFAAGKVACVGNSITEGYGIQTLPDMTSYPYHLQNLLRAEGGNAANDTVGNFGVSGLMIRKADAAAYWSKPKFISALEFEADTVIIGLGTNDAKSYVWNSLPEQKAALDSAIFTDYKSMIDTFQVKSKPRTFLILAPYTNNAEWQIFDSVVVNHIIPAAYKAAMEKGVNIIDLHSSFSYLQNPNWYLADTVHPSVEGAKELAKIVYSYLQKDNLQISQNKNVLTAPQGFDYQWYKDGALLTGETSNTLTISDNAVYTVSVKIEENTQSRIVTHPYTVTSLSDVKETTSLAPQKRLTSTLITHKGNLYTIISDGQTKTLDAKGRER